MEWRNYVEIIASGVHTRAIFHECEMRVAKLRVKMPCLVCMSERKIELLLLLFFCFFYVSKWQFVFPSASAITAEIVKFQLVYWYGDIGCKHISRNLLVRNYCRRLRRPDVACLHVSLALLMMALTSYMMAGKHV